MNKKYSQSLKWNVKFFDINKHKIIDYNILEYKTDYIKKLKKKSDTKDQFSEYVRKEIQYHYWSRAEYELIIEITEDNHIILKPWCCIVDPEKAIIDVTNDKNFDWRGFAEEHINKQVYINQAKIDIYDQLIYGDNWDHFITYLWTTRLKYERDHVKFHE